MKTLNETMFICTGLKISLCADVVYEDDRDDEGNGHRYHYLKDVYIDFEDKGKVSILELLNLEQYNAIMDEL